MNTQTTKKDTSYNGWKNYQTWNIALWIGNDESLYNIAVSWAIKCKKEGKKILYRDFILYAGLIKVRTPDKISFSGQQLDYKRLSEMLEEFAS